MGTFRQRISAGRWWAFGLLLVALACHLAIPAGYMPFAGAHGFAIVPCSGHGPMDMPMARGMAMPGHGKHGSATGSQHGDTPCGFSVLADTATGGADLPLIVAALAFVQLCARRLPVRSVILVAARWRPPLRAPPA